MEQDKPIGMKIAIIGRLFKKEVREECIKQGINVTYSNIIMHLVHNPEGLAQNVIAEKMHMAAPTISLTIKNMENDGLVVRTQSKEDSRISIVTLTEEGKKLDNFVKECFEVVEKRISEKLGEKDLKTLSALLDELLNELSGEVKNV